MLNHVGTSTTFLAAQMHACKAAPGMHHALDTKGWMVQPKAPRQKQHRPMSSWMQQQQPQHMERLQAKQLNRTMWLCRQTGSQHTHFCFGPAGCGAGATGAGGTGTLLGITAAGGAGLLLAKAGLVAACVAAASAARAVSASRALELLRACRMADKLMNKGGLRPAGSRPGALGPLAAAPTGCKGGSAPHTDDCNIFGQMQQLVWTTCRRLLRATHRDKGAIQLFWHG